MIFQSFYHSTIMLPKAKLMKIWILSCDAEQLVVAGDHFVIHLYIRFLY